MSFNKITFGKKELCNKTLQKINFLFSNGDNFDVLMYKKNRKTHVTLERKYLKNMMGFSFMNGGNKQEQNNLIEIMLPMIEAMFLPLTGSYSLDELKFKKFFFGTIKNDMSSKLSNSILNHKTEEEIEKDKQNELTGNSGNFFANMFSSIGQVWEKDYDEIQEEEELDAYLEEESTSDKNNESNESNKDEKVITIDDNFETEMDKNVILFDFELNINNYEELIEKIKGRDVYEIFDLGKESLKENSMKGKQLNGIEKVEFFGENNSCVRIIMLYGDKEKEYLYNVEDIIQIKEFLLKIINYMKDENATLV